MNGQLPSSMLPKSVMLLLEERARQVVQEGYTAEHDAEHAPGVLAAAGGTYALPSHARHHPWLSHQHPDGPAFAKVPDSWPWGPESWKPTPDDRLGELVKAGALIIAEIDRLIVGTGHRFQARREELIEAAARGEAISAQDYVDYFPEMAGGPGGSSTEADEQA